MSLPAWVRNVLSREQQRHGWANSSSNNSSWSSNNKDGNYDKDGSNNRIVAVNVKWKAKTESVFRQWRFRLRKFVCIRLWSEMNSRWNENVYSWNENKNEMIARFNRWTTDRFEVRSSKRRLWCCLVKCLLWVRQASSKYLLLHNVRHLWV